MEELMNKIKKTIYANQVRMRTLNQLYVYIIHLVQGFLNIMPPIIRNLCFKIIIRRCGNNVFFDYNVFIKFPWLIEAGNNVSINRGVQFFPSYHGNDRILLGNDVYLAPNVCFFASGHDTSDLSQLVGGSIIIGDHVWIGANTIILPGIEIGADCVIGAGSVVTKNIPANSIAAGNPAKIIKDKE